MSLKKLLVLMLLIVFSFSVYSEDVVIPAKNTPVYVKHESMWVFKNDGEVEKPAKDVKEKALLYLGNKVTVVGSKKRDDKYYLNVQLPDQNKYWGPMDYFVTKFIVILQNDTVCYKQPDASYNEKYRLPAGVLGYYVKTSGDFINLDISSWIKNNANGASIWPGNIWIKANQGYSEDVSLGIQATYLSKAFNNLYSKTKSNAAAIAKLKEGLKVSEGLNSPLDPIFQDLLKQLEGDTAPKTNTTTTNSTTPASDEENIVIYYAPIVDNLRFRETASMDGNVVRMLQKGEKLKLLETGSEITVNDIKGHWKKFQTQSGEIGWCFDGYLQVVN